MRQPVIRDGKAEDADAISDVCLRSAIAHVTHSDDKARYECYLVDTLGPLAVGDELADGRSQFLVAEREGRIVGVMARKVSPLPNGPDKRDEKNHIRHFYVEEPGQGIGRCLWEEMRWRILADQIDYVTVNSTYYAKVVYEKLGFRADGPEEEHGGLSFQHMGLDLAGEHTPLPLLIGPRIIMRSYRLDDMTSLQRQADNKALAKTMPPVFPHPFTMKDAEFWVRFTQDKNIWAVTLQNEVIGNLRLVSQDLKAWGLAEPYGAEIRYWIGEDYWRRGYGTEMLELLIVRLRNSAPSWTLSYTLVARVPEQNVAGRRLLEKLGFDVYRRVKRAHQPHPVCKSRALQDCLDLQKVLF